MNSIFRLGRAFTAALLIAPLLIATPAAEAGLFPYSPSPTPYSPADGSSTADTQPVFSWSTVPYAALYQLQVTTGTDRHFRNPLIHATLSATSVKPTSPLAAGSYRWRVRVGSPITSKWTSPGTFTVAPPPPPPPVASGFNETFSNYPTGVAMRGGSTFGPWSVIYSGYGGVMVEAEGANNVLHESPMASTAPGETHASLVVGPSFSGPLTFESKVRTVQQLRTGSAPNAWEVAWVLWHYTDDTHFYYFAPKTNGWELGKEDPAYPGAQRFLATGSSPTFPVGRTYSVKIRQDASNTFSIWVDGVFITAFTDTERPYTSGRIGLYNEDAHVHFDDVKVTQP